MRGKVDIGFPVGCSVTLPFHSSMMRLLQYELGKPERLRRLVRVTHASSLYVADNRTLLVQQFLGGGSEWLLQVDTDIEFPETLLESMVDLAGKDRKVLAASVPLGVYDSCAFRMTDEVGVWETVAPVPTTPVEVDGIATAVVLTHRSVFEAIAETSGQSWFHHIYLPTSPKGTTASKVRFRAMGEDLAFSIRAKAAGFAPWCVHVPGLRHYKTRALTHDARPTTGGLGELVTEGR